MVEVAREAGSSDGRHRKKMGLPVFRISFVFYLKLDLQKWSQVVLKIAFILKRDSKTYPRPRNVERRAATGLAVKEDAVFVGHSFHVVRNDGGNLGGGGE